MQFKLIAHYIMIMPTKAYELFNTTTVKETGLALFELKKWKMGYTRGGGKS